MSSVSAALDRDKKAHDRFVRNTAEHEMSVLHEDGLYRHVRFAQPGTSTYYYDLVTWPGNLVICGDAGDWHFARIRDMFEFFTRKNGATGIDPHYWAQKLQGRTAHRDAEQFSEATYRAHVRQWLEQHLEDEQPEDGDRSDALRGAVQSELLQEGEYGDISEQEAHRRLREFEHEGTTIYDPADWDLREYHPAFLWACWAIVEGVARYRARSTEGATA